MEVATDEDHSFSLDRGRMPHSIMMVSPLSQMPLKLGIIVNLDSKFVIEEINPLNLIKIDNLHLYVNFNVFHPNG